MSTKVVLCTEKISDLFPPPDPFLFPIRASFPTRSKANCRLLNRRSSSSVAAKNWLEDIPSHRRDSASDVFPAGFLAACELFAMNLPRAF